MDKKEINMNNEDMKKFYEGKPVKFGETHILYTKDEFKKLKEFFQEKEKYEKLILPNYSFVIAGPKNAEKDFVSNTPFMYFINQYGDNEYCLFLHEGSEADLTWFGKEIFNSFKKLENILESYKNYKFVHIQDVFKTHEDFLEFIGQEPKK
mgnify:CR=1 FL=1